jgi:4-amino-4-deoxy-L-arabinose transferase-like glycosyltransferase
MWAMARLAVRTSGDGRSGFYVVLLVLVCPPVFAVGSFMTIDSPMLACWALGLWSAWSAFDANHRGQRGLGAWAALGVAMGVGFCFKYSLLLLAPGLVVFMVVRGRWIGGLRRWPLGLAVCIAVFLVCVSPVIIWNAQHDWPTLRHTMGHMAVRGGDTTPDGPEPYDPMWTLELIGGQIGIVGPPLVLLIAVAAWRRWTGRHDEPAVWTRQLFLLVIGLVTLAFFLAMTHRTDIEANWPMPAYLSLLVVVAGVLPTEIACYRRRVAHWRARPEEDRPKAGFFRRKPETPAQIFWHWSLAWGLVAAVAVAFAPLARHLPGVPQGPFERAVGHRDRAQQVQRVIDQVTRATGKTPIVINEHYMRASLLAFYLPARPRVYCAQRYLGSRANAYDYFPQTDLADPILRGRDAVMVDGYAVNWRQAFEFGRWDLARQDSGIFIGHDYQGPRHDD